MDEKDFFNKDSMYWREVNVTAPSMMAEIELIQRLEIEGEWVNKIACVLLPFESADVIHEMENGAAFKKNEVISWPYILSTDLAFYKDESKTDVERKAVIRKVDHSEIQSITLTNEKGEHLLTKAKI